MLAAAMIAIVAAAGCGVVESKPEAKAAAGAPPAIGEISLATPQELKALIEKEKGKVVVMNFWATWCPPCVKELPEFAKFWREYDGKGARFISVSADYATTKDTVVAPFVKSYEIPFPVRIMAVEDPNDLTKVLGLDWDGALPATFVYGPGGKMVWSTIGNALTRDALAERIKPLLPANAPAAK